MNKEKLEPDKKVNLAGILNQMGKPERERRAILSKKKVLIKSKKSKGRKK